MIDRIQDYPSSYTDVAEEWKALATEYGGSARLKAAELSSLVKNFVIERPAQALGIALGLGVALGWLIKRR